MSPALLFTFVVAYFLLLLAVAWRTSKGSDNESFFIGNRNSNWMLVAFGMIGTSLSGVTFVSVPGAVSRESFAYFQITLGYFIGYLLIAFVLLPVYYRLQLTSIYNYLNERLGFSSYKTGAGFFILSRVLGATARLYLVVNILQDAILSSFHIPFWLTTLIILLMILLYTYEGGVKTIVWTDTLQTTCMLGGMIVCVIYILQHLNLNLSGAMEAMQAKGYSKIFFTDPDSKLFFLKQIVAGMFITLTMTGMDQEMMQKSISVKRLKDSQKNMVVLGFIMLFVIFLFLFLGGLLHLFAAAQHLQLTGDKLFPELALHHMPKYISIIFIIALISALFPSSDGAITALTASFCIDILGIQRNAALSEERRKKIRQRVHLLFVFIFLLVVLVYKWISSDSMIGIILKVAAYTYGPLLGLFSFSILTKRKLHGRWVPFICILSPLLCYLLDRYQETLFGGKFHIGLELLLINGLITFTGLYLVSFKPEPARADG
jgi:Na+/proline symporter